ncbi:myosin-6-like [Acropora millepora]|uniref:myosin-6-like n=1 Tax=Acropora millepora TaxID=45264 RepID=UPI001CF53E53|nr:myosin-6-like [Acropora millepora]XP_029211274.2 myosin-6-like [Acropora millepora]XP_029211275.2 myosin-6-like [Acropora millepora]
MAAVEFSNNRDDLKMELERLSIENRQYLDEMKNAEVFKMQIKETRKEGKHLEKKKERLEARLADFSKEEISEQPTFTPEVDSPVSLEDLSSFPRPLSKLQPPQSFSLSLSGEESLSSHPEESSHFPPPPKKFSMNGETSPELPATTTFPLPRASEAGLPNAHTWQAENQNRHLVAKIRKLEEQVQNLVQERGALETKYQELERVSKNLTVENQRLSQQVSEEHVGKMQKGYNLRPLEEVQLLRAQLKVYEEDFKKERSDKEQLSAQKERLKKELRESQATVAGLQSQLKQALAGEGGYGEPRPPIFVERQPYYPAYPARIPLDYGIRRTYSGDYIGPGATNEGYRGRQTPAVKKSFLSPDMTAVIDRDVVDGKTRTAHKSI